MISGISDQYLLPTTWNCVLGQSEISDPIFANEKFGLSFGFHILSGSRVSICMQCISIAETWSKAISHYL